MKIDTGHICKNCIYYTIDECDTLGYCCIEPLYTRVKPNHTACESYVPYEDDDCYTVEKVNRNDIYDEEDDNLDDYDF